MTDVASRAALALPFRRFTLVTPLTDAEVRQRVRTLFVRGAFQGMLTRDGFTCTRVITYRNSFLPHIEARFASDGAGTTVHVTMRLHGVVQSLTVLWPAFALLVATTALGEWR